MEQNTELTLEESIKQVMQTLPPVVRSYLAQGKYTLVAKDMMFKYSLRIDQGGVLEREIVLLLMGIETPVEFAQTLTAEAKLDQQTVKGIVQDINEKIFIPLQEEEKKVGMTAPEPASHFHLDNKIPSAAQPSRPPISQFAPMPERAVSPRPATIAAAKPAESNTLLEDHEEPHIEFHNAPASPVAPTARIIPPPANLPGVVVPHVIPVGGRVIPAPVSVAPATAPAPTPAPSNPIRIFPPSPRPATPAAVPPAAPKAPPTPAAPAKPYAADPYREPVEP
ncbi:MAG: hypothetical protein WC217_00935 [Candidatus Paceibacterota bacterium]|jgi:hypothetical protein